MATRPVKITVVGDVADAISGLKKVGDGAQQMAKKATDSGGRFSGAFGKIKEYAGAAGLAIGGAFVVTKTVEGLKSVISTTMDFDKALSAIKANSGATTGEMDLLRAKALQLGKDTTFGAGDAAQAILELSKAGVSTKDILGGAADATVALAAAGGIKLPEAATQASNAMNAFGLTAGQLPGVANIIAGAANASAIDVSDFGFSLGQTGAVAHLAGASFRDTSVVIAEMGNAGIKGADAGTSMKTMFQRLQPSTKAAKVEFEKLGLMTKNGTNAFYDQTGKLKPLSQVQGLLQKSLKGMSAEQKQAALNTMFGSDAIRAAAVMAGQGAAGFDKMATAIGKTKASDVAAERMNNLSGKMEQFKGSVETIKIAIGEKLMPVLMRMTDGATRVANAVLGMVNGTGKAPPILDRMKEAGLNLWHVIQPFAADALHLGQTVFPLLVRGVQLVGSALVPVTAYLKSNGDSIRIVAAAVGAGLAVWKAWTTAVLIHTAAVKAYKAVQVALDAAMAANGVMLVIIAIAALAAGLIYAYRHSEAFRAAVQRAKAAFIDFGHNVAANWATVRAGGAIVLGWFRSAWPNLMVWLSGPFSRWVGNVRQNWATIRSTASGLLGWFRGAWPSLLVALSGPFSRWMGNVRQNWATIRSTASGLLGWFRGAWPSLFVALSGPISRWVGNVRQNWATVRATASGLLGWFRSNWPKILAVLVGPFGIAVYMIVKHWGAIRAATSAAWGAIRSAVGAGASWVQSRVSAAWGAVRGATVSAWGAIRGAVQAALATIFSVVLNIMGRIRTGFMMGWNTIRSATASAFSALRSTVQSALATILSFVLNIMGRIRTGFMMGWNTIRDIVSRGIGAVRSTIEGPLSAIVGVVQAIWSRVSSAFSTGMTMAVGTLRGFAGQAVGALGNLGSALVGAGGELIHGLMIGIQNYMGAAYAYVQNIAKSIVNTAKSALGIHSPSTVFAEIGGNVALGLAQGIDRGAPGAAAASARMAGSLSGDVGIGVSPGARAMRQAGGHGASGGRHGGVTVNVGGSRSTPAEIAAAVAFGARVAGL